MSNMSHRIVELNHRLINVVEKVVTRITTSVTDNLIETTPVATFWARSNWLPSISSPIEEDLRAFSGEDRAQYVADAAAKQASGKSAIQGYQLSMGSTFITNNVHYIEDLNNGTSTQAPRAFVQSSISQGIREAAGGNP